MENKDKVSKGKKIICIVSLSDNIILLMKLSAKDIGLHVTRNYQSSINIPLLPLLLFFNNPHS